MSASFRPTPLPISDIPATTAKNKTHRGIRFPHMRLACTRWIHFGRDIPLSPRRYRASASGETFRPSADKSAIYRKRERPAPIDLLLFFLLLSFRPIIEPLLSILEPFRPNAFVLDQLPIDVHIHLPRRGSRLKYIKNISIQRACSNRGEKTVTKYTRVRRQCEWRRERERESVFEME